MGWQRVPAVDDVGLGVEDAEQLVERRRRRLHRVVQLRQLLHGLEQLGEEQHGSDHRADRDVAPVHQPAADADDQRRGEDPTRLDQAEIPGGDLDAVDVGVEEAAVGLDEPPGLLGLTGVRLDHPDAGDALLQGRHVVADVLADVEVRGVRVALELA